MLSSSSSTPSSTSSTISIPNPPSLSSKSSPPRSYPPSSSPKGYFPTPASDEEQEVFEVDDRVEVESADFNRDHHPILEDVQMDSLQQWVNEAIPHETKVVSSKSTATNTTEAIELMKASMNAMVEIQKQQSTSQASLKYQKLSQLIAW